MSAPELPVICSFWHGAMSWLERLSIASFLAHGHRFELYAYERPLGLPEGCVWRDAAEITPREGMFFYKGDRSPAVFADLFRLLLMRAGRGIWVDCDMVCLRPFTGLEAHVFGYEHAPGRGAHAGQINNAVLRLPQGLLLDALIGVFADDGEAVDPVWMPRYRRLEIAVRRLLGQRIGLTHMQFGATGPFPLTHFARALGLDRLALPPAAFYPLPYGDVRAMLEPGSSLAPYVTDETYGIHLWRMALTDRSRRAGPDRPQPQSALAALMQTHAIEAP